MKQLIIFSLVLCACAPDLKETCEVTPTNDGYILDCPNSEAEIKNGQNGAPGEQGKQGDKGVGGEKGEKGDKGDPGDPGSNGSNGNNGHSLVSRPGVVPSVCSEGGNAIDIFLDLDDNLTFTIGDIYQSSVFVCNGENGSGTSVSYNFPSDTTCKIVGTNVSAVKPSLSSNNLRLYNGSSCAGTHIEELSSTNELYWLNNQEYYAFEGSNTIGITLRKVTLQ